MRVLMANEPRSHREVFAGVLRAASARRRGATLRPDALVCSRVTPALRTAGGHWMKVRLEEGSRLLSTSDAGGSPDPGLDVLLKFVDRGEERPEPPGKRMTPVNGSEV